MINNLNYFQIYHENMSLIRLPIYLEFFDNKFKSYVLL